MSALQMWLAVRIGWLDRRSTRRLATPSKRIARSSRPLLRGRRKRADRECISSHDRLDSLATVPRRIAELLRGAPHDCGSAAEPRASDWAPDRSPFCDRARASYQLLGSNSCPRATSCDFVTAFPRYEKHTKTRTHQTLNRSKDDANSLKCEDGRCSRERI